MGTYEFSGSAGDAVRLRAAFEAWLSDPSGRFVVDVASSASPVSFVAPPVGDSRRIQALKVLRMVCAVSLRDASSMLDGDRFTVPAADVERFAFGNGVSLRDTVAMFEEAGCRRVVD